MAEDFDSTISLNIDSYHKRDERTQFKSKKIVGNRGQRIRARKSLKRFKERVSQEQETKVDEHRPDNQRTPTSNKSAEEVSKKEDTKEVGGKKKTGDVISSLFRHNPDIPAVSSGKVTQVKEQLFASDSFKDVPLHPYMISNLEKLGFTKMTSVQFDTIPRLVGGHDLMVKSQTGSGKTMAYAIPIIEDLARQTPKLQRSDGCRVIVLVPTRELAIQSYDVFLKLLKPFTWIVPGCIMGGEKRKAEKARLRKGINILVATPGRLIDHIENTQNLALGQVKWLVLDEADRLLDMGFEAKVAQIIQSIDQQTTSRQTVLLSATLTEGVERLAGISLKNPQKVAISSVSANSQATPVKSTNHEISKSVGKNHQKDQDQTETAEKDSFALPESLKQYFLITPCKLRLVVLLTLVMSKCRKGEKTKMIVFISTQDGVEFLYQLLTLLSAGNQSDSNVEDSEPEPSLDVYRLHGDMSQKERTQTYEQFCNTRSGVLLCTDVAARGLHLPSVHWVVQFSCAPGIPDYVHRVGRTARAGSGGSTLMFLLPSETGFLQHLNEKNISLTEMKVGEVLKDVLKLVPNLPGMADSQRQLPHTVEEAATYLQNCCEMLAKNNKVLSPLAKTAYQSYIRAYATYPHSLKSVFHIKHLHLGHVAKTFGLREAPSNMGSVPGIDRSTLSKKRKHDQDSRSSSGKKRRLEQPSEFKSPLVFKVTKKKKTTKPKHKKQLKKGKKKT